MSTARPTSGQMPILIAGPTASGKSALALALARRLDGCIINADSMQVYRELRILSARPSADEEASVPHRLYGHVPASEAYSAGRFVDDVARAIAEAAACGFRPIITGGTGLYFKALLEGLSPIPPISEPVRSYWRAEGERVGSRALHALLTARDPRVAARLSPSDTQRIVRALEVLDGTGRSLAHWQSLPGTPVIVGPSIKLLVSRPRADLYERADARFDSMMAQGALAEAERLAALQLSQDLPAMRALGVAPLVSAARGVLTPQDAVMQAKLETRRYIKRQETWAQRYMIAWKSLSAQETASIASEGLPFIDL